MQSHIDVHDTGTSFVGPQAIAIYRAIVIRQALDLYAKTGLKANRAYTPSAMLRVAGQITGRTFTRRDYAAASAALNEWIEKARAGVEVIHT